ncbi:hypothetical protein [Halobacillus dabanensis]|uniref:hypothetical protein n=1 Tax=Halobacillus dabanensis TaxID=240302 RepID=UPI001428C7D6|nr:hypothetical protein [Halobacillus dabanensis]
MKRTYSAQLTRWRFIEVSADASRLQHFNRTSRCKPKRRLFEQYILDKVIKEKERERGDD